MNCGKSTCSALGFISSVNNSSEIVYEYTTTGIVFSGGVKFVCHKYLYIFYAHIPIFHTDFFLYSSIRRAV